MGYQEVRVLVVDSNKNESMALANYLTEKKYNVKVVNSSGEALELFQDKPYHIVFVEIDMPEMDGLNLLAEFKTVRADAYIIMMNHKKTLANILMSRANGAIDFIEKPFGDYQKVDNAMTCAISHLERWQMLIDGCKK